MNLKPDWKKLASDCQKLIPDWKTLIHKGLPYALAVVLASATFLSVLGVRSTNAEYVSLQGSRNELENEKRNLSASQQELEAVLQQVRHLLRCEVMNEPVPDIRLGGLDAAELRKRSHRPQDFYGQPHFMPDLADGRTVLLLNRLRTLVRHTERKATAALPDRTDILQALNRLSSYLYLLMIQEKSK